MTSQNISLPNDPERIFSRARGDHIISAAISVSIFLSLDIAANYFSSNMLGAWIFILISVILGFFIPILIVSVVFPYWIDNTIEAGHFWKELIES